MVCSLNGESWKGFKFVLASRMFAYDLPHSPFVSCSFIICRSEYEQKHLNNTGSENQIIAKVYLMSIYRKNNKRKDILRLCNNEGDYSYLVCS